MTVSPPAQVPFVDGQFSDPEEEDNQVVDIDRTGTAVTSTTTTATPRRIDDPEEEAGFHRWSGDEDGEEEEDEEDEDSDDDYVDDDFDLNHGDHWFSATGDFTKQYNRLKTQLGSAHATSSAAPAGSLHNAAKQTTGMKGQVVAAARTAAAAAKTAKANPMATTAEAALSEKLIGRIRLDATATDSSLRIGSKKGAGDKNRDKDKSDRATVEQVLDPRTRIILFKLLNSNIIYEINGCVSTGKEANVYHATTEDGQHRALKIYKTSILTFKDRDRYVSGEYRFRHGYSKSNPRKMVKVWAEKEMRNLKRLHQAGIPCPEPILLRMHVLLMTFIGDADGWAAPRLKDAVITDVKIYRSIYHQLLKMMWMMYHKCKLVHGDLSEYNLLYQKRTLYIIDVSQSVEHDHPHALEFLRKDVTNVVDYFRKRLPEQIMTVRELFDFVVGDMDVIKKGIVDEEEEEARTIETTETDPDLVLVERYLRNVHARIADRPATYLDGADVQVDEEVFKQLYIPRTLDDVADVERDVQMVKEGKGSELMYAQVTGLAMPESDHATSVTFGEDVIVPPHSEKEEQSEEEHGDKENQPGEPDSGSDDEDSENESDSDDEYDERTGKPMKKDEDKDAKKERKNAGKEAKREKRKAKVPKAVKKRKEKVAATRKGGNKK
ncbi:hypothetical protein HKX48_009087 [Thoreauomyces humboldtii]|nr:hypothetical protein HKX48_009087 [Thoreauomyces humboldtii]